MKICTSHKQKAKKLRIPKSRPKVILYVEQNTDGTIGGSHFSLLHLVRGLDKDKYQPIVLFYQEHALLNEFEDVCAVKVLNLNSYARTKNRLIQRTINLWRHFFFVSTCVRLLFKYRISLIHLNDTLSGGWDTWGVASLVSGVPCITHERGYPRTDVMVSPLCRWVLKRYRKIIAVSDLVRDRVLECGIPGNNVETVYNGLDIPRFRSGITKTRDAVLSEVVNNRVDYAIVHVGNLRRWKGQHLLLEAVCKFFKSSDPIACLFVGNVANSEDREYKRRLADQAKEAGFADRIVFTGYRQDVANIVNAADVIVNSSIEPEPFGRVIIEGMCCAKPVVCTDIGAAKEIITDGHDGFLVSHVNNNSLGERLRQLFVDDVFRKKMGQNAEVSANRFRIEENVAKTEQIYSEVWRKLDNQAGSNCCYTDPTTPKSTQGAR